MGVIHRDVAARNFLIESFVITENKQRRVILLSLQPFLIFFVPRIKPKSMTEKIDRLRTKKKTKKSNIKQRPLSTKIKFQQHVM